MNRFKKTIMLLIRLITTMVLKPHLSAQVLLRLPRVVEGLQFSRTAEFPRVGQGVVGGRSTNNPLLEYFDTHTSGPGIWKWLHYFDVYRRHFEKFVGREVHILEVGIYSGGSLGMWRKYFGPGCRVYGVDIEKACLAYSDEHTKVFIGDQEDRGFWDKVKMEVPTIDIIIDDGGHKPEQQRVTLEEMLPHLRPGGIYLCEDIHGQRNPFSAYVQGLAGELNFSEPGRMPDGVAGLAFSPSIFQQEVDSIHLYPFVTVIERRQQRLDQLIAPKHGSQWQPFL